MLTKGWLKYYRSLLTLNRAWWPRGGIKPRVLSPPFTFSISARNFCRVATIQNALDSPGPGEHSRYSPMQATFFFRGYFQVFRAFPAIFSFLRVVWPWFFYQRIARSLESVFHTLNMFPKWFPVTLQPFEAKTFNKKWPKCHFWTEKNWYLDHD